MRRLITVLGLFALLAAGVPAAVAGPTAGGIASDNVEYVGFVPFDQSTSTGLTIHGKFMYLTSWKNISAYDISDPESPQLLGQEQLGFMFENEDVAVSPNDEFLLFSESLPNNILHVYDIEDKSNIQEIAQVEGAGDHTTSCILKCKFSYGSDGSIVDLRDPAKPKLVAAAGEKGNWHELIGGLPGGGHDVTEYRNGFILVSPIDGPPLAVDVRNPVKPKIVARGTGEDVEKPISERGYLWHSGNWPRNGKDKFLLMQGERNFRQRCNEENGPFATFDASKTKKTGTFALADTYRVENGTYADGNPAVNGLGCSAHWFENHPTFKNGGLVAIGYYEHGTRLVNVDAKGKISEVGYFLPYGGSTSAAYWATESPKDRIVYAVDYTRGLDILRFTGDLKK